MIDPKKILIRELSRPEDLPAVVDIWLNASILAHDFMPSSFWESKVADMRDLYLPASTIYLALIDQSIVGFYALHENSLAAIFVAPDSQGQGIGRLLLNHAITYVTNRNKRLAQKMPLTLTVYKANHRSCEFYQNAGFTKIKEQLDPHTQHPELVMELELL